MMQSTRSEIVTSNSKKYPEIEENDIPEEPIPHKQIWLEFEGTFNENRKQVEEYKKKKLGLCQVPNNLEHQFLEEYIFPCLIETLKQTLWKAKELYSLKYQKTTFNGIDYIAELLWNLNPKHPERKQNWIYIHDIQWAKEQLQKKPRPLFPFSYVWSRNFAALKIQSAMRGHWVRCRPDVQEMRTFWRALKQI